MIAGNPLMYRQIFNDLSNKRMEKELILKAIDEAYSFVKEQKQSKEGDELLINLFKAKALVENLPIHDVSDLKYPVMEEVEEQAEKEIGRLESLDYINLERLFINAVKWVKIWQSNNR